MPIHFTPDRNKIKKVDQNYRSIEAALSGFEPMTSILAVHQSDIRAPWFYVYPTSPFSDSAILVTQQPCGQFYVHYRIALA